MKQKIKKSLALCVVLFLFFLNISPGIVVAVDDEADADLIEQDVVNSAQSDSDNVNDEREIDDENFEQLQSIGDQSEEGQDLPVVEEVVQKQDILQNMDQDNEDVNEHGVVIGEITSEESDEIEKDTDESEEVYAEVTRKSENPEEVVSHNDLKQTESEKTAAIQQKLLKKIAQKANLASEHFVRNEGQVDRDVDYYASVNGGTVYVSEEGITYDLLVPYEQGHELKDRVAKMQSEGRSARDITEEKKKFYQESKMDSGKKFAFRESFLKRGFFGGMKNVDIDDVEKKDEQRLTVSYFTGDQDHDWVTKAKTYKKLSLGEIWSDISVELVSREDNLEKIFIVHPAGEVEDILLEIDGSDEIAIDEDTGELRISTGINEMEEVRFTAPVAYQDIDGQIIAVDVRYRTHGNSYGFEVGDYNTSYDLIIDPLLAGTYVGGGNSGYGLDVTTDISGNIYVTGLTYSSDFPTTFGAYDTLYGASGDVFVAKFDSDLKTLLAATYLGGADDTEGGQNIHIDPVTEDIIITGYTESSDFPTTSGAYDQTFGGGYTDSFIARFDNDLEVLQSSTYLGGSDWEGGWYNSASSLIDADGNIIITGYTESSDFPTTSGAYDQIPDNEDIYITKVSGDLSTVLASTVLGGSQWEYNSMNSIDLDSSGNIIVTGATASSNFPTTSDAYDPYPNETSNQSLEEDFFVTKFDPDLTTLQNSTLIGGMDEEGDWCAGYQCFSVLTSVALDANDNIFITGSSYEMDQGFPYTTRAYDTNVDSNNRVFVGKFDPDLEALFASTFMNELYCTFDIEVNSQNDVFVTGMDYSDFTGTTSGAYDEVFDGRYVAGVVAKLDNSLSRMRAATLVEGSDDWDEIWSMHIDSDDAVIFTGYTESTDFPTSSDAYSSTLNGRNAAIISKLSQNLSLDIGLVDRYPEDDSINMMPDENYSLTFEIPVVRGNGIISIMRSDDDSLVEMIRSDSWRVTGWGTDTITIDPALDLMRDEDYYISMESGFVSDGSGHTNASIDTIDWNFSTRSYATIVRDISSCECYEVGTAEASQPFGTVITYSDDDRSSWDYIPVADDSGIDCAVTNVRLQYDDLSQSMGEATSSELSGALSHAEQISEGDGKIALQFNDVNTSETFTFGGDAYDEANDMVIDSAGNKYITGTAGGGTAFTTKFNADDSRAWTNTLYSPTYTYSGYWVGGNMIGKGVAVDSDGTVIVVGEWDGTVDFDPSDGEDIRVSSRHRTAGGTYIPGGSDDIFITKYAPDGSYIETLTFKDVDTDIDSGDDARDVVVDASDNIYLTGIWQGTVDFDATAGTDYHTASGWDSYLTKYNADGSYGWTRTFDLSSYALTMSDAGDVTITGGFYGTVDFDGTTGIDNHTSNGSQDIFFTKYNADGSYGWTRTFGGPNNDYGYNVVTDVSGNVFTTGSFQVTANFDGTGGTDNHTSNGGEDVFLTKYNADGSYGWTRTFGGADTDRGYGITTNAFGHIFLTGTYYDDTDFDGTAGVDFRTSTGGARGDVFITRYNADNSYGWTRVFGGNRNGSLTGDQGRRIFVDQNQDIVTMGGFYGTVDFDDTGHYIDNYSSEGYEDVFVSTYHADGSYADPQSFYSSSGFYQTVIESEDILTEWGAFSGMAEIPGSTSVSYEIRDSSCANVLVPQTTTAPIDLSPINVSNEDLCLRAYLATSDDQMTPKIDEWQVTYEKESLNSDPQFEFSTVAKSECSAAEVIRSIPSCECFVIGSVDIPSGSTISYSDNNRSTWDYSPVDDGSGKDCSVTDIKVTQSGQIQTIGEDVENEFLGALNYTDVVNTSGGEVELYLHAANYAQAYAILNPWDDNPDKLLEIDTETGAETEIATLTFPSMPTETVEGGRGIATHPLTGELYGVLRLASASAADWYTNGILATIDPNTGEATEIGGISDRVADIAFDADGNLYGATGNGNNLVNSHTLYSIDITDATMIPVLTLPARDDGTGIAYNKDDGNLYHGSGTNWDFDVIDPDTMTIINTFQANPNPGFGVGSMEYVGNDTFMMHQGWNNQIWTVDTSGNSSQLYEATSPERYYKGFAVGASVYESAGEYKTIMTSQGELLGWNNLIISEDRNPASSLRYEVLDRTCSNTLISETTDTNIDLSGIDVANTALCLRTIFETTDLKISSKLESWTAEYSSAGSGGSVSIDYDTAEDPSCGSDNDEEEENEEEGEEKEEEEEGEIDECSLESVKDVTATSVLLRAQVDDSYADEKVKFKVETENLSTRDKEIIKLFDKPSDNGKVSLEIDNLLPQTEYRFKLKYEEEDDYVYCPHSKTVATDPIGPIDEGGEDDNDEDDDRLQGSEVDADKDPESIDIDGDGIPNDADVDPDGDGINDNGTDTDGDGINDASDNDIDGDGISNENDVDQSEDADMDGDGIRDSSDVDPDGDGINDNGTDTDGDGINDASDNDIDGDGIPNDADVDPDGDGINDNGTDTDGDGINDSVAGDMDADGISDEKDADVNGDGIIDNNFSQVEKDDNDQDADGISDEKDADVNGDGIIDNGEDLNGNGVNDAYEEIRIEDTSIALQIKESIEENEGFYTTSALVGVVTGTVIAAASTTVPFFTTLPFAAKDLLIMPFLGIFTRRRNEQNWGTVFEATTKQPLPGTKLVLTDQSGKEIETTYSDRHGRFGFLTESGSYIIQPQKSKFDPNFSNEVDSLYGKLYTGGVFTISDGRVLTQNIAMSAQNIDWTEYAKKKSRAYKSLFSVFKKWLFTIIFYGGFLTTAMITYFFPTAINIVLLLLYIVLFLYDKIFKRKKYGTVETENEKPVPFAIVSLHDKNTHAKENFAVTDVIGRYYLLSENGSYNMKVKGQPVGGHHFEKQGDIHVRDGLVRKDVKV